MNTEIKDKIAKVLELANRGIEGEKNAAKLALDRLMKKYNISEDELSKIRLKTYTFSYKTNLDISIFCQLVSFFFKDKMIKIYKSSQSTKTLIVQLEYLDWVTLDSSYEYFRKHAAKQFNEFCIPHIKKCRTTKTKNARRKELQNAFFSKYVIASKIYHPEQVMELDYSAMSNKELEASYKRAQILGDVEGGQYHTQVSKETLQIG